MILLGAFFALIIGAMMGTLGGGGAIITLPMLVYVLHVDPKAAIAASLAVVGSTAVVGATLYARAGLVRGRIALLFGGAAMAGAYTGGRVAHFIPSAVLLVMFGAMMLAAAALMLEPRAVSEGASRDIRPGIVVALGAGVGLFAGVVGAGGGFLIVPVLVLYGGLPMREAVGTSLLIMALQSFAGFAGHLASVHLDYLLVGAITAASIAGSVIGAALAKHAPAPALRKAFAYLVIVMGLFVLGKQLWLIATAGGHGLS